jgi:hypothetical protein
MVVRVAEAGWQGDLDSGQGRIKLDSGAFAGSCSYPSRFESAEGAAGNKRGRGRRSVRNARRRRIKSI